MTPVDGKIYNRIFQKDRDGQAVLDELARLFYDRPSYVKGDPYETAYREGQRATVAFIIRKCGLIGEGTDEIPKSPNAPGVAHRGRKGGRG